MFQIQKNGLFQSRATGCRIAMLWWICKTMCKGTLFLIKTANSYNYSIITAPAQAYIGELSYKGRITFLADSFACRTRAKVGERVLSLSCGSADSRLNDSLFAPESDTALRLDAANLCLETVGHRFIFICYVGADL